MKITLHRSNLEISLGFPAVESFDLTPSQLRRWNSVRLRTFAFSANDAANVQDGLPEAAARRWLQSLHSNLYGIAYPTKWLTWADVKAALL